MGDIVTTPPALSGPRIDVGNAANFLLGGIPGDVHDIFIVDVEPGDLMRASCAMTDVGDTVRTVHVTLSSSVASLERQWEGAGAAAFETDIWEPLSAGLGVLESECHTAASQLKGLAAQAAEAHEAKVMQLDQEIQTQLNITAASWVIASPEAAGAIGEALGNLAGRLGGELVKQIVGGIVETIGQLIRKVVQAFAELIERMTRQFSRVSTAASGDGAQNLLEELPVPAVAPKLLKVRGKLDPDAVELAKRIGGESQVCFADDPAGKEFDVVSDKYIGEAKPGGLRLNEKFRNQAKVTFLAAKARGRDVYYHFNGPPDPDVIKKLNEYSRRYRVPVTIDVNPF
jgi:uncharacterized protein YukE